MAAATLDYTLLLGMAWPTGQKHKAPVFSKGSVKLADVWVVETGPSNTCLEVIKSLDTGYAPKIKEGILVGTHERYLLLLPHRLFIAVTAAVEYHPEYLGAPPPSTLRVKRQQLLEEVNLRFLTRRMLRDSGHLRAIALYLADKAFYGVIAMAEVIIIFESCQIRWALRPLATAASIISR